MIEYALFSGCNIPARLSRYEDSARAVLENSGVKLIGISDFSCCGYPLKNIDHKSYIVSAAKNLALAEKKGLNIITLCKCCFGSLKNARYILKKDESLLKEVNKILGHSNLTYEGKTTVKHFLSVLYHEAGIENIKKKMSSSYENLKIATHYGCHALRPSKVTEFDNAAEPTIFDELIELTGAVSIDWATKLDCCGAPLTGINNDLSMDLTRKKLEDARHSGADYICTACPFCHLQFDAVQRKIISYNGNKDYIAPVLYTQVLGLCMGIDEKTLGLGKGKLDISGIKSFLTAL